MYTGLKHLHSGLAYLVLAFLVIAVIFALIGWLSNRTYTSTSKRITLFGLIATHSQVLFGLILYFVSPVGMANFSGEGMKDSISRLYFLEHPVMMIVAAVLITIGYSRAKRAATDQAKFKSVAIFYAIGLVLILSRIPWHAWPAM